ncbi:hypothetical protein GGU10DRAFT_251326, partial [Lentinula aff. detonsa]
GWLPECRGATAMQFIQGGSSESSLKCGFCPNIPLEQVVALNISSDDLYTALLANPELQPPNLNLQGRQAHAWK